MKLSFISITDLAEKIGYSRQRIYQALNQDSITPEVGKRLIAGIIEIEKEIKQFKQYIKRKIKY